MSEIWLSWALLVAAQVSPEAVGQLDLPSPWHEGPMFGERLVYCLACAAFSVHLLLSGRRSPQAASAALACLALAGCAATIDWRPPYVGVMLAAQVVLALQALAWARGLPPPLGDAGRIVAWMQAAAAALFAYAQLAIGLDPAGPGAPAGALAYLHGPLADLLPAVVGTALLARATLRRCW